MIRPGSFLGVLVLTAVWEILLPCRAFTQPEARRRDRLPGIYRAQPAAGHTGMVIGIDTFRDPEHCNKLSGVLLMPFVGSIADYAINRRWNMRHGG